MDNPDPNTSERSDQQAANQTIMNQTTADRLEKNKYKFPILSDRETDLTKINPRMWWEQISEYIHLTYNRNLEELMDQGVDQMDPHTVYHIKGDVIWDLGPKAKHEIMRGQWGKELKDIDLPEMLKLFKKTFIPARNVFHSRAQFFNIQQDDNETLDEYWKRLVDIERKCEFNSITPEEIITYKFAATINDKKARDKFIKGPLKLQMVLETIEQDNYNRKYGDKKKQTNDPEKSNWKVHEVKNKSPTHNQYGNKKPPKHGRRKCQTVIVAFAVNQIGQWNIFVQHGEHSVITVRRWATSPKCANPKPSAEYKKNRQRTATPNHGLKLTTSNPSTA